MRQLRINPHKRTFIHSEIFANFVYRAHVGMLNTPDEHNRTNKSI